MILLTQRLTLSVSLFFILILGGCASYQSKVRSAREALTRQEYTKALQQLRPLAEAKNDDQLVYLLDYAVALQIAGRLQESNQIFLQADRLAESIDYQSVSRIAGSLALNEEMVQYKGDTFEKIFINAYLAMNFLELGQLDEALVEARRINEKYQKYRVDEKQTFELNSFSKYLSAMIWEANHNYDDAYIAFNEAYKLDPNIKPIQEDLIRTAKLSRRMEDYKAWKKKFPNISESPSWYDRAQGELIVIYQQGWGPRKKVNPEGQSMPILVPVHSETQGARLVLQDSQSYLSREVYDVQSAAIETLKEDYGVLFAKRLGGIATKAVLADQLRQKNKALGDIAYLAMLMADRADVRQWSFLPQTIQIIRVRLKPGTYQVKLEGLGYANSPTGEETQFQPVEVKAGRKKFIVWRSLR